MNLYQKTIQRLIKKIPPDIVDISKPRPRGRRPTQAFSAFLTNREQGNWAENLMQSLINKSTDLKAVKYGRTDNIIAGDPKFPEFYESYQDELDNIGKKPDLLLFPPRIYSPSWKLDISQKTDEELEKIVKKAKAGLEIRSSAFLVSQYEKFMTSKHDGKSTRSFLSFTPKVEDLLVIYKWIMNFGVKHFYIQVFFDRVYAIAFKRIIEILANPKNRNKIYTLEKNAKNQFKSTLHLNLNNGVLLVENMRPPQHSSRVKELSRGRLLYYVKFKNGKGTLNTENLLSELDR